MRGYLPIEELCGKAEIEGVKVGESGSLIIYARNLENRESCDWNICYRL